jgi:hypothetical protein
MTRQKKGAFLIQVTARAGLIVYCWYIYSRAGLIVYCWYIYSRAGLIEV